MKYSLEKFNEVKKEADETVRNLLGHNDPKKSISPSDFEVVNFIRADEIKIFNAGKKEAVGLNKEYESKKKEMVEILNKLLFKITDLSDFEKNKLGSQINMDSEEFVEEIKKYSNKIS
jgi:hypothetical protein